MKLFLLIGLLILSCNSFGSWYTNLPTEVTNKIKDDYWSKNPSYSVNLLIRKSEVNLLKEQLIIEGYSVEHKTGDVVDNLLIKYEETQNKYMQSLKYVKIIDQYRSMQSSCPLYKENKKVAEYLLKLPNHSLLQSTLDESYLLNYHKRLEQYCNKTLNKNVTYYVYYMGLWSGLNLNMTRFLAESNDKVKIIYYQ